MLIAICIPSPHYSAAEITAAVQRTGMETIHFSWDKPVEKWGEADAYILLSDSKEDCINHIAQYLIAFLQQQSQQGKAILGLGFGSAKLLADNGLIPGLFKNMAGLSLVEDFLPEGASTQTWVRLSEDYQYNAFTQVFPLDTILPVRLKTSAKFLIPPGLLAEIKAQGLPLFLYCNAEGQLHNEDTAIAAIANKAGNVMAMVPHPENTLVGDLLFHSLRSYLEMGYWQPVEPLYYWPRK